MTVLSKIDMSAASDMQPSYCMALDLRSSGLKTVQTCAQDLFADGDLALPHSHLNASSC